VRAVDFIEAVAIGVLTAVVGVIAGLLIAGAMAWAVGQLQNVALPRALHSGHAVQQAKMV
jgi:phage-related minor tail protein